MKKNILVLFLIALEFAFFPCHTSAKGYSGDAFKYKFTGQPVFNENNWTLIFCWENSGGNSEINSDNYLLKPYSILELYGSLELYIEDDDPVNDIISLSFYTTDFSFILDMGDVFDSLDKYLLDNYGLFLEGSMNYHYFFPCSARLKETTHLIFNKKGKNKKWDDTLESVGVFMGKGGPLSNLSGSSGSFFLPQ
jgi:hypothetical protein